MTFLPCDTVRPLLEPYHDDELPLETVLAVREHVEHCAGCASEAGALARLREALGDVAGASGRIAGVPPEAWTGHLLAQVQIERQLSWHTWMAHVFDDMHLVWPALGASVAVMVCLLASGQVMEATAVQRPDSLAGVIDYLANPGSNVNPTRIDEFTAVPRRHASADWPLVSDDAVVALSTVVTREGRIGRIEMLSPEQVRALKMKPAVVEALIEAASRAQFEPARTGGAPVAVNLVWLLAHTTVVGRPDDIEAIMRPPQPAPVPAIGPRIRATPVKATLPAPTETSSDQSTTVG
jgi:Putative zinc-finger